MIKNYFNESLDVFLDIQNEIGDDLVEHFTYEEWVYIYLSDVVCNLTTYDFEISLSIGKDLWWLLDVVGKKEQLPVMRDKVLYEKYIRTINLFDVDKHFEWGTSIRYAWFESDYIKSLYEWLKYKLKGEQNENDQV